jgi:Tfp pilus assembly protein PilO
MMTELFFRVLIGLTVCSVAYWLVFNNDQEKEEPKSISKFKQSRWTGWN